MVRRLTIRREGDKEVGDKVIRRVGDKEGAHVIRRVGDKEGARVIRREHA